MSALRPASASLFLVLAATAARAGGVIVVDPANPGAYWDIQPAIDAASDGDTVLVKSGFYGPFEIQDKDLRVVADVHHTAAVAGTVVVRGLSAGKDVVLTGLVVVGIYSTLPWEGHGLYLENDAGSVRVQDCKIESENLFPAPASRHAVVAIGCADVVFTRCALKGGKGYWHTGGVVGSGLVASGSNVALYECFVAGGRGSDASFPDADGQGGGHAFRASNGFLFASGGSFAGGRGGDAVPSGGWDVDPPDGGDGGNALHLGGPAAQAELFQVSLLGGAGGAAGIGTAACPTCPGADGHPGAKSLARRNQVLAYPGNRRILIAPALVRELVPVPISCEGVPGELVFLRLAAATSFQPLAAFQGVMVADPYPHGPLMVLGPTDDFFGNLSTGIVFPDLGPGVDTGTWHLQSLHRDALGRWILGGAVSVVVLDSAF